MNSKILIKDKYTKTKDTSLTFFQRLNKQPPFFSKFYPIYNQQRKHLKPLSGNIYNFSIKQVHQYDKKQNKQQFYMSDFEFKPIHKFFKITISSIKYLKNSNSDIISLHIYQYTLSSNFTFRTFRLLRNQRYNITDTRKSIPRK